MLGNMANNSYYSADTYRKNIVPYHFYYVSPNLTNKQFYHKILTYYQRLTGGFT